jgi:hypothetical protein
MCPGIHVAERNMYTAITRLLWAFNIKRVLDKDNNPTPIEQDAMTPGFMVTSLPFE